MSMSSIKRNASNISERLPRHYKTSNKSSESLLQSFSSKEPFSKTSSPLKIYATFIIVILIIIIVAFIYYGSVVSVNNSCNNNLSLEGWISSLSNFADNRSVPEWMDLLHSKQSWPIAYTAVERSIISLIDDISSRVVTMNSSDTDSNDKARVIALVPIIALNNSATTRIEKITESFHLSNVKSLTLQMKEFSDSLDNLIYSFLNSCPTGIILLDGFEGAPFHSSFLHLFGEGGLAVYSSRDLSKNYSPISSSLSTIIIILDFPANTININNKKLVDNEFSEFIKERIIHKWWHLAVTSNCKEIEVEHSLLLSNCASSLPARGVGLIGDSNSCDNLRVYCNLAPSEAVGVSMWALLNRIDMFVPII